MSDRRAIDVVVCDEAAANIVKGLETIRLIRTPHAADTRRLRNVFVLWSAVRLPESAGFVSSVNREHRLRALFVRQDADPTWLPQLLERARLRAVRNMLVHHDSSLPRRVLSAWAHGGQEQLIANATVVDDPLLRVSCALETLEVPFDALPALKRIPERGRGSFVVSEDGSYIHWPEPDIHLDLDALKSAVDSEWHARASAIRLSQNRRYGDAIARLRSEHGLRQGDIPDLSQRQVRRIESGSPITGAALRSLATAHKLALDDYLSLIAKAASARSQGVFRRAQGRREAAVRP